MQLPAHTLDAGLSRAPCYNAQVYPVDGRNLNYAPVTVGCVIAISGIYWLVSARKWFEGPVGDANALVLDPDDVDPDTADASVVNGNDYNGIDYKADIKYYVQ